MTGCDQLEKSRSDGEESRSCRGRTGPDRSGDWGRAVTDFLNNEHSVGTRRSPVGQRGARRGRSLWLLASHWLTGRALSVGLHVVRELRKPYSRAAPHPNAPHRTGRSVADLQRSQVQYLHSVCFRMFQWQCSGFWFRSVRKPYSNTSNRAPREFATFGRSLQFGCTHS